MAAKKNKAFFAAFGRVFGKLKLLPEAEDQPTRAAIVTPDRGELSCKLSAYWQQRLAEEPHLFEQDHLWFVYFRAIRQAPHFIFFPIRMYQNDLPQEFILQGVVVVIEEDYLVVRIKSNGNRQPYRRNIKPFTIRLEGTLPQEELGNFWRFEAQFDGEQQRLVITDSQKLKTRTRRSEPDPSPEPENPPSTSQAAM